MEEVPWKTASAAFATAAAAVRPSRERCRRPRQRLLYDVIKAFSSLGLHGLEPRMIHIQDP